jgi:8-oxo-dGTP pyrophosphatase MutT (NUDIX family)
LCFLALRNNPADPAHGGDFLYVVTGNVDQGESLLEAVLREVEEETGIVRIRHISILPIEKNFVDGWGRNCHETFFAIITDQEVRHLSEEHIESHWFERSTFLRLVRWFGSLDELAMILDHVTSLANEEDKLFFAQEGVEPVKSDFDRFSDSSLNF